jgi:hypothetical protein
MRRRGGSDGVKNHLFFLGHRTREELLVIFVNSPEFQGRVQDVIDVGCYE